MPRVLRTAGLQDVRADAYFPIASPACTALEIATVEQIRERLVTGGIATDEEIDEHLANVGRGDLDLATAPLISAWGRRPLCRTPIRPPYSPGDGERRRNVRCGRRNGSTAR